MPRERRTSSFIPTYLLSLLFTASNTQVLGFVPAGTDTEPSEGVQPREKLET